MSLTMSANHIKTAAAWLLSDSGENVEYDRGVAELVTELIGESMDNKHHVLQELRGLRRERHTFRLEVEIEVDGPDGADNAEVVIDEIQASLLDNEFVISAKSEELISIPEVETERFAQGRQRGES